MKLIFLFEIGMNVERTAAKECKFFGEVVKSLKWQIGWQYIIPLTVLSFMFITLEFNVETKGESYNRIFGFPFPAISGEMCDLCFRNAVFIVPLLVDIFLWFIFWITFVSLLQKAGMVFKTKSVFIVLTWGILSPLVFLQYILLHSYSLTFWYDQNFEIIETNLKFGLTPP